MACGGCAKRRAERAAAREARIAEKAEMRKQAALNEQRQTLPSSQAK